MAAATSLTESGVSRKSPISKSGVLTLSGFGIRVNMHNGHLAIDDGVGLERRSFRLARVGHGLKRLVLIGSDGFVSLAALRWLADQDIAFVMLERNGKVLCVTGPVRPSDARLRRAQALAASSEAGLQIVRGLISRKLAGQERVARDKLLDPTTAQRIATYRDQLGTAQSVDAVRLLESQAGAAYWTAWHDLPVMFPKNDIRRIPDHWLSFGRRISPLSGSPRLAVTPAGAILNFLYALLEAEARLSAAAVGLDPGLGLLHFDSRTRDSLACDLMEPVRADVDRYVLHWITRQPLRREWFFEERNGNCRLTRSLAVRLSETAPTWGRAVAPVAEWFARALWETMTKPARERAPATRLTQQHKRESRGGSPIPQTKPPRPQSLCRTCGGPIRPESSYCASCGRTISADGLRDVARLGRIYAQRPEAKLHRAATKLRHDTARRRWSPALQPSWLNEQAYFKQIQPRLGEVTISRIAAALGICEAYAADIRAGRRRPHPRHWQALAQLVESLD